MKDFAHFRGEFEKFKGNEPLRRAFLGDLMKVLYRRPHHFLAIGCAVDLDAFRSLAEKMKVNLNADPYFLAFVVCIRQTMEDELFKNLPTTEKFAFIFDRQSGFEGVALKLFNKIKDLPIDLYQDRLESVGFGSRLDSRHGPALQAADLAAYEIRKSFEAKLEGKDPDARWPMRVIKDAPCIIRLFDQRSLGKWFAGKGPL